jgi:UV DNA damage endonuclease
LDFNWKKYFKNDFREIGDYVKDNDIRISMHPGQYNVINSINNDVFDRTRKELDYHADVLDLFGLNTDSKIQVHIGGVFGNKELSKQRFITKYKLLSKKIKKRLVIENDHVNYTFKDCLEIYDNINIPILFDTFHHEVFNNGEEFNGVLESISTTWTEKDGLPMFDYSSQKKGSNLISHAETINIPHFKKLLKSSKPYDFDIMLEIKDKEHSAIKAINIATTDERFRINDN